MPATRDGLHVDVTLPASADSQRGVEAVAAVQRPVVDNLRVVLSADESASVDVQLNVGELGGNGVVVPLSVADLGQFPAEFSRPEAFQVAVSKFAAQQQDQAAVADEQGEVVTVHL